MNRKILELRLLGLMVLIVGGCFLWSAQPASAAITRWAKWKVDFAFPNNQMDAVLTVQVGHTTSSGTKVIDQEKTYTVTCQTVGNVVVQNEIATFGGSGYYQCNLPSIKQKVAQMTNGTLLIADSCDSKRPYITSNLTLEGNPINSNGDNPLFHRDDLNFSLPLNVVTQEAQLLSEFAQAEAESSSFPINSAGNNVMVLYDKTGANQYTPNFLADALTLSSTPPTLNGPIPLSTLASTVYVGYSPDSGKYFEGKLETILVDPYCVGTG
jgi:hypothetical protein